MIIPYGILTDTTSVKLRKYIFENHSLFKVEAFPERDNTKRRVFEDVKMSTAILLTSIKKNVDTFDIGISYTRQIQQGNRASFNSTKLIKLNPALAQIPLTDSNSFDLLLKIYGNDNIVKLGTISPCLTGEVDMTFGKNALTQNPKEKSLIKGVQIDRYIHKTKQEDISQGDIEYINPVKFEKIYTGKKLDDIKSNRIVLQGLTGVNEKYRLKATLINCNYYLANLCNYILKPSNIDLEIILAWLNSSLFNFVFKAKSTSSNVNGYEVNDLPFIINVKNDTLKNIVCNILKQKRTDLYADTKALEKEIDDVIYQLFDLNNQEIKIIEK